MNHWHCMRWTSHLAIAILPLSTLFAPVSASAAPFTAIRIGDIDGFGYPAGLKAASGNAADTNGNGVLEAGEFLPDLEGDGGTGISKTGTDWFDNRSPEDVSDRHITGSGWIDGGSSGSQFTDRSLSLRHKAANREFPLFHFNFFVDRTAIDLNRSLQFKLVLGDSEVRPTQAQPQAIVRFTRDGLFLKEVAVQPLLDTLTLDGLIQAESVSFQFSDLFEAAGSRWNGRLDAEIIYPSEPYIAFDYAEISVLSPSTSTPEPNLGWMVLFGMLGLLWRGDRR